LGIIFLVLESTRSKLDKVEELDTEFVQESVKPRKLIKFD
jgi:hypothetical protein